MNGYINYTIGKAEKRMASKSPRMQTPTSEKVLFSRMKERIKYGNSPDF